MMIICQQVEKRYGTLKALDGVELTLAPGEPIGLVGANGAGKTTLFSILCGFLPADTGTVEIFGKPAGSAALKGKIGILPQDASFFKQNKLEPQLRLFATLQGMTKHAAKQEAERVMHLFEINDLAKRKPEQLSYGQKKRCAMAQAMVGSPALVLLDEPTSGLDPVAAEDVRQLIRKQCAETTFLISSHNVPELQDTCSRIVVMNQGKIIHNSSISELLGQQSHLNLLLTAAVDNDLIKTIKSMPQVETVTVDTIDNKRLSIQTQTGIESQHSMEILKHIENQGVKVLEFNRGKRLSEEISSLLERN